MRAKYRTPLRTPWHGFSSDLEGFYLANSLGTMRLG